MPQFIGAGHFITATRNALEPSPCQVWIAKGHNVAFVWHGGKTLNSYAIPSWAPLDAWSWSQHTPATTEVTDRVASIVAEWDAQERGE